MTTLPASVDQPVAGAADELVDGLAARVDGLLAGGLAAADGPTLADAVRQLIVAAVTEHGGHLGSNLGVVELTIALHRALDPADAILFDTGHQAYVHKILTGRAARFALLRQQDGLSGYPSRQESPRDWIENSHASTALGWALGLAQGGFDRRIVAVVGDGALTGGPALEALNAIGALGLPVTLVYNDNGRSYAPTVSTCAGGSPAAAGWFSALGWNYTGPVDGHDFDLLDDALAAVLGEPGPAVLHAVTDKGRGCRSAEDDDERKGHDVRPRRAARARTYTDVFAEVLLEEATRDPAIVGVTAAMPHSTGLARLATLGPGRLLDVGIAEATAVTAAAGLAAAGRRPVVAVFATFLGRAIDQIIYDVALHGLPVVFAVDRAGITGPDGPSHHGLADIGLLRNVPGLTILAPSGPSELEAMVRDALRSEGPCAIRWPTGPAPEDSGPIGRGHSARLVRRADDAGACILAVGAQLAPSLEAADILAQRRVACTVWDVRAVHPLDPAMLADAARHPIVVVTEDGFAAAGAGAGVAMELAGRGTTAVVAVAGVGASFVPAGPRSGLLRQLGLDGEGLAERVLAAMAGRTVVP